VSPVIRTHVRRGSCQKSVHDAVIQDEKTPVTIGTNNPGTGTSADRKTEARCHFTANHPAQLNPLKCAPGEQVLIEKTFIPATGSVQTNSKNALNCLP